MVNFISNNLCRNAQHTTNTWGKWFIFSAIVIMSMSSCINDDLDDCVPAQSKLSLSFEYTYNVKNTNAFAEEVRNINVYAFDENGKYLNSYTESKEHFEKGYTLDITDLKDGKYTFVCLARDRKSEEIAADDEKEFQFSSLPPGVSTIEDLTERMGIADDEGFGKNDKNFAALYTAQTMVDYKTLDENGKPGKVTTGKLSLMKCTNTYRIVLMPYDNEQTDFSPENFDVYIQGSAAWLDHKGDKVRNAPIVYLPYNSELKYNYSDMTTVEGEIVDRALVYDLSSSRMFERNKEQMPSSKPASSFYSYDDKRIVIWDLRDKEKPRKIFDHSLPWFLALCGEGQGKGWGAQEYLDRQDHYILTFYVPDQREPSLLSKVKINGWVVNLLDSDLGNQ